MRPAILIDVDEVLNPSFRCNPPYCRCHPHWIRAFAYARDGQKLKLILNPAHGPALLQLAADTGAELAWCTSWEDQANDDIGPRIGLPRLPVVPYPPRPKTGPGSVLAVGAWKARHAVAWAARRPFAWFEDEPDAGPECFRLLGAAPHLVIPVDRRTGLTVGHMNEAWDWLSELTRA